MKTARTKFTLIELLIVVSIIAILAGLLLPALNSARQKALGIQCVNNQKQMLSCAFLYAGDYSDTFPTYGKYSLRGANGTMAFSVLTGFDHVPNRISGWKPYMKMEAAICPAAMDDFRQAAANKGQKSYGWLNMIASSADSKAVLGENYIVSSTGGPRTDWSDVYINYRRLKQPGGTVLVIDCTAQDGAYFVLYPNHSTSGGQPWLLHQSRANAGFGDGHAAAMSFGQLKTCAMRFAGIRALDRNLL